MRVKKLVEVDIELSHDKIEQIIIEDLKWHAQHAEEVEDVEALRRVIHYYGGCWGVKMNFNNLDPNEKLALILFNKKTIAKMFDTFIGIAAYMLLFSIVLFGIGFVLYQIKCALGINLFI